MMHRTFILRFIAHCLEPIKKEGGSTGSGVAPQNHKKYDALVNAQGRIRVKAIENQRRIEGKKEAASIIGRIEKQSIHSLKGMGDEWAIERAKGTPDEAMRKVFIARTLMEKAENSRKAANNKTDPTEKAFLQAKYHAYSEAATKHIYEAQTMTEQAAAERAARGEKTPFELMKEGKIKPRKGLRPENYYGLVNP